MLKMLKVMFSRGSDYFLFKNILKYIFDINILK